MKNLLLILGLICIFACPMQASCNNTNISNGWTCTISVSASSANTGSVTTAAITSSGNLAIIAIHAYVGGAITPCTPTDNMGNSYNPLTQHVDGNSHSSDQIWYLYNPTVGAGHTFTCNVNSSFPTITVAFFKTAASSPFDVQNGSAVESMTTLATGSTGTLNAANELLIASCTKQGFDTSSTTSFNAGFTTAENSGPVASEATGGILAYLTQAGTGAVNATCTIAMSDNMAVSIATFKQSGAAPSVVFSKPLKGVGR